jgi:hypothetical protein
MNLQAGPTKLYSAPFLLAGIVWWGACSIIISSKLSIGVPFRTITLILSAMPFLWQNRV